MVGIVIVSHSRLAAEGIRELAAQMAGPDLRIIACGGMEDGSIGTDAMRIQTALIEADSGDGVCAMVDLGSGIMSTETAIELLESDECCGLRLGRRFTGGSDRRRRRGPRNEETIRLNGGLS